MADAEIAKLYVELSAKTSELYGDLDKAEGRGSAFSQKMSHFAVMGAEAIGGAAIALGAYSLKAADDLDVANRKLDAAAKAAGVAMSSIDPIVKKADAQLEKYGYTNTQTSTAIATLVEAHIPLNEQMDVLQASANLAAARHLELGDALKAVLLGAQGSGKALKEYGINLPPTIANSKALESAQASLSKAQEKLAADHADASTKTKTLQADQERLGLAQQKVDQITQDMANHFAGMPAVLSSLSIFNGQAAGHAETLAGNVDHLKAQFTDMAAQIGTGLMPYAMQLSHWAADEAAPAMQQFAHWITDSAVPGMVDFAKSIGPVASGLGGDFLSAFRFLSDHAIVLEELISLWVAKLVVMKSLDMALWMRNFVSGFSAMTEGAGRFSAVMATLGMSGSGSIGYKMNELRAATQAEAEVLGGQFVSAATSAANATSNIGGVGVQVTGRVGKATEEVTQKTEGWGTKLAGLASYGIPAIGLAAGLVAPIVISHWGEITDAFKSSEEKLKELNNSMDKTNTKAQHGISLTLNTGPAQQEFVKSASSQFSVGPTDALEKDADKSKQLYADLTKAQKAYSDATYSLAGMSGTNLVALGDAVDRAQAKVNKMGIPPEVIGDWNTFDGTTQSILDKLQGDSPGITRFLNEFENNGHSAALAMDALRGSGDQAIDSIAEAMDRYQAIDWNSTKTGFDQLHDSLMANYEAAGKNATEADQLATALATKLYPNAQLSKQKLQELANQLTGGNVPALQAMIQASPDGVKALQDQAAAAKALADQAEAARRNINNMIERIKNIPDAKLGQYHGYIGGLAGAEGAYIKGGSNSVILTGENNGDDEVVLPHHKSSPGLWAAAVAAIGGNTGDTGVSPMAGAMMASGGGGGGGGLTIGAIIVNESERPGQTAAEVRDALLEFQRQNGGMSLGLS